MELLRRGHSAEIEHPIKVEFKGAIVGEYEADLLVDGKVIVELKVAKEYNPSRVTKLCFVTLLEAKLRFAGLGRSSGSLTPARPSQAGA